MLYRLLTRRWYAGILLAVTRRTRTASPMTQNLQDHEPTEEEWRELARQAREEKDLGKALDLAQQIVEKYDEEKRRKN